MEFTRGKFLSSVPSRWFSSEQSRGRVLMSAYQCLLGSRHQVTNSSGLDLGDAIVVWHWGTVSHLGGSMRVVLRPNADGNATYEVDKQEAVRPTRKDCWTVVLQKHGEDSLEEPIEKLRERRAEIVALLTAAIGLSCVFELELENSITRDANELEKITDVGTIRSDIFRCPFVSAERLHLVEKLQRSMEAKSDEGRRRLQLGLHWFQAGSRSEGVDAFVSLWIALEALVLGDSHKIFPLKASVGRAYGMTPNEANQYFGLGRMYRYRSEVLHGREKAPPTGQLLHYLAALVVDVLFEQTGIPSERRAAQDLPTGGFDAAKVLG
jgi:hypothetical protein